MENEPTLSIDAPTVEETDGSVAFTLTLSEAASRDVTVDVTPVGGTATLGADAAVSPRTVTIPAGETTAEVAVDIFDDQLPESDESVVVELANPDGARFPSNQTALRGIATIRDDDGTGGGDPSVFVPDVRLVEGDDGETTASFQVVLSRTPGQSLDLTYATAPIDATAGTDFVESSGSIALAADQRVATVDVPVTGDTTVESAERIGVRVETGDSLANEAAAVVGEATVLDDDAAGGSAPVVNLGGVDAVEAERDLRFPVTLSSARDAATTVAYRTRDATAAAGSDFAAGQATFDIAAGERTGYIAVQGFSDSISEGDERFALDIANPTAGALAGDAAVLRANGILRDDDTPDATPRLMVRDREIVEGDGDARTAVFDIALSRPPGETVTLSYTTAPGSATAGDDFTAVTGDVTFAPGQRSASVAVDIAGDTAAEASETFSLVVTPDADRAAGVADAAGTATILDDDGEGNAPVASITDVERLEGFGQMAFTVVLSEPAPDPVDIDYATRSDVALTDGDFASKRGTLTISGGERTGTFTVETFTDPNVEPDEAFVVELANPDGASLAGDAQVATARGVLRDDDGQERKPSLFVDDVRLFEGDADARTAVFDVELSRALEQAVTLPYTTLGTSAAAGSDFESRDGTLRFEPGQVTTSVRVPVFGDTEVESSETVELRVGDPGSSRIDFGTSGLVGTARILDDDAGSSADVPTVDLHGVRTSERAGEAVFTVEMSEPAERAVGVDVTTVEGGATAGADFEAVTDTAVVPAGATTARFPVQLLQDEMAESDESFQLRATNAIGAELAGRASTLTSTATIVDDDAIGGGPSISVSDVDVMAPFTGSRTATFTVAIDQTIDSDVTADVALRGTSAEVGGENPDVTISTDTLTIPAGRTSVEVTAEVQADSVAEGGESFLLEVSDVRNARVQGARDTAFGIGRIADAERAGTVFLEAGRGVALADSLEVLGRRDGDEQVFITSDARDLRTEANIEQLDLDVASADVDFAVTDAGLNLTLDGETLVTIPSLNQAASVRFTDGDATLTQTGARSFTLDGGDGGSATIDASGGDVSGVSLGNQTAQPRAPSADGTAARAFLNPGQSVTVFDAIEVLGRADTAEAAILAEGASGVRTDANIERLDIPIAFAELDFSVADAGLRIADGDTAVVTVPSLNQGAELRFANGDASVTQTGAQTFDLTGGSGGTAEIDVQGRAGDITLGGTTADMVAPVGTTDGADSADTEMG